MSEFSGFISKEILHVRSKKKSPILSIKCLPLQRIVLSGFLPQKLSHESHKFRHITGKWMFRNYYGLIAIMPNYYQRMLDSHTKFSNHLVSYEKTKTETSLEKVWDSTKVLC